MYTLHIGNKNYSSWSLRPWILMTELAIEFDEQLTPFDSGSNWDKFRTFSPNGLVPCLVDREGDADTAVWDSLAIMEYLAETDAPVWPQSRQARAWARCATAEMHSGYSALRNICPMNCALRIQLNEITVPLQKDLDRIDELWSEGLSRFGGPFLAGEKFTAVDAFYAPVVFRLRTYGFDMSVPISSYLEKMLALDSMTRWNNEALAEEWLEEEHEKEATEFGVILKDYR